MFRKFARSHDFRFRRGAFDHGRAFGQHGGHHDVVGAENGRAEFAAQIDHRAGQFRREHFDVAAFDPHRGAERFESLQMQIDRPIADDAAAGQRNGRFLATAEQRTEHANRGAHFAHDFVGRDRFDLLRLDRDGAAGAFHLRAEMRQDLQHVMRVAQVRHAMQNARLARQQRRGQDRQRRIFRAADLDRTGERMTAVNENFIHTWRRGIVSLLHNLFSPRCRDNSSRQKAQQSVSPGRSRFRARAIRRAARCGGAASISSRINSSPCLAAEKRDRRIVQHFARKRCAIAGRDVGKIRHDQVEFAFDFRRADRL